MSMTHLVIFFVVISAYDSNWFYGNFLEERFVDAFVKFTASFILVIMMRNDSRLKALEMSLFECLMRTFKYCKT